MQHLTYDVDTWWQNNNTVSTFAILQKNIDAFREKLCETAPSYILPTKDRTTQTGVINSAQKMGAYL